MTGPNENSEFCFPETLNAPRGEAITVFLYASHQKKKNRKKWEEITSGSLAAGMILDY